MSGKLKLNIMSPLLVLLVLLMHLLLSSSATPYLVSSLVYLVICAYVVGAALVPKALNNSFIQVSHGFVSILLGFFVLSLFVFFTVNPILLLPLFSVPAWPLTLFLLLSVFPIF